MTVYRICKSEFKNDISGNGARQFGSRWNYAGVPLLYTAEFISLAALEMLVHLSFDEVPHSFHLISILVPDNASSIVLKEAKMKKNWENDEGYTAWLGSEFIKEKSSLLMKVPSVIVKEENNYLLNPWHADYKKVQVTSARPFVFDKRLFRL